MQCVQLSQRSICTVTPLEMSEAGVNSCGLSPTFNLAYDYLLLGTHGNTNSTWLIVQLNHTSGRKHGLLSHVGT